jgi:1-acyl-sn-glycerol-3-phosphate acyltransferase
MASQTKTRTRAVPAKAPGQSGASERAFGRAFGRDPAFVDRVLTLTNQATRYFSPEVRGLENLPTSGPVLLVGNHSGMLYIPDFWMTLDAVTRRRDPNSPTHMMIQDSLMKTPGLKSLLSRLGAVPASHANAEAVLGTGALLVVYPGGDWEACRPWRDRDLIDFHARKGFVRLALRQGVPVVPVVEHGSQHTVFVLSRGDRIANALRMPHSPLRFNVLPFVVGPPFGVSLGAYLPMPAAVTVEFLPALGWSSQGAAAAEDPTVVQACYDETVATMQAALDRLSAEDPHPLMTGSGSLVQGIEHQARHVVERMLPRPRSAPPRTAHAPAARKSDAA